MPKPWGENPKTFNLARRSTGVPFSFRDPDGDGEDNVPAASLLFSDNFDDQPDYFPSQHVGGGNSAFRSRGETVPNGWDAAIGDAQALLDGAETFELSGNITEALRGGAGKSLIFRRRTNHKGWHGEGELTKNFYPGLDEVFVKFWIKFQAGWFHQGRSKMFRIGSYPEGTTGSDYWSQLGMGVIWDYVHSASFGVRNNYFMSAQGSFDDPIIGNEPHRLQPNKMAVDGNFTTIPYDLDNDGIQDNDPQIANLRDGGVIPNGGLNATHDVLLADQWHKMEFYLKVNSAPGAQDGVLAQWFDDSLVFLNKTMPWIQNGGDPDRKFTAVKFGGNNHTENFGLEDPAVDQNEWYAIDDVEIYDGLPDGRVLGGNL